MKTTNREGCFNVKKTIAMFLVLVILTGSLALVGTAYATQKSLKANILPDEVYANARKSYSLTITNDVSNPGGNKLGSAIIAIPDGFVVDTSSVGFSPDMGWILELSPNSVQPEEIKLTAEKSRDCIPPGRSIVVSFDATAPSTPGPYDWSTIAFTSPSWAGDLFTLTSDTSELTVMVLPPPQCTVRFIQQGAFDGFDVTYWIDNDRSDSITKPIPFDVQVDADHKISYEYPETVNAGNGNLYSLNHIDPESIQSVTDDITVTGYYDEAFGITGGEVQATTIRSADPIVGLLPFPDGVIGYYYQVTVIEVTPGTFTITLNYGSGFDDADEKVFRLYMSDPVDFNGDRTIDGNDVSMIQAAIHSGDNDPTYDINHDKIVDQTDLKIVQEYSSKGLLFPTPDGGQMRLPWIDITTGIDVGLNEIYGETDYFSGFGVH